MKIFLSHGSHQKPLIREIISFFPKNISNWLDENDLLFGDDLSNSLEYAIKSDVDYVLLFLDNKSAHSPWVKKEINWALEKQQQIARNFLLVVLTEVCDNLEVLPHINSRKYIKLDGFSERDIKNVANEISSELFSLICRDLERIHMPKIVRPSQKIDEAEGLIIEIANLVRKAVFPHRQINPISITSLINVIGKYTDKMMTEEDFENILNIIIQRNLIPGLSFDGFELYLIEEHALWKAELYHTQKLKIARRASSLIKNNMSIFIDAGSTTAEIVKIICKRIETRSITQLKVTTTSVNHADMISDCCVSMGFDDSFSAIELFIPGGRIRPNTQAIVAIDGAISIDTLHSKKYDIGFIGANGIDLITGITTHNNEEVISKKQAIKCSEQVVFVCDDSKIGLSLDSCLSYLEDDYLLITNENAENNCVNELKNIIKDKLVIV